MCECAVQLVEVAHHSWYGVRKKDLEVEMTAKKNASMHLEGSPLDVVRDINPRPLLCRADTRNRSKA